jgi:hypothetical protein
MARDQLIIKNAPTVGKHGGDRVNKEQPDSGKVDKQYGNSLEYRAGRLKRDRPDLAEKVEAGELLLREAAIAVETLDNNKHLCFKYTLMNFNERRS